MDLFASEKSEKPIILPLQDGDVLYYPSFFSSEEAATYFKILLEETSWQQDEIKLFGKTFQQPRLTALYGSNSKPYSYSGITMFPKPFTTTLQQIKERIESATNVSFTTVLLNLYRTGADSNGWHSDNEKELGTHPFIASVSFGTDRMFHFKHKQDKNLRYKIVLKAGSLLIMKGTTQKNWLHQLPKSKKIHTPRINLTFRIIQ